MSSRNSRVDECDQFALHLPREQNPLFGLDLSDPESPSSSMQSNTGASDRSHQSFITVEEMQQHSRIYEDGASFDPVMNWQCCNSASDIAGGGSSR